MFKPGSNGFMALIIVAYMVEMGLIFYAITIAASHN